MTYEELMRLYGEAGGQPFRQPNSVTGGSDMNYYDANPVGSEPAPVTLPDGRVATFDPFGRFIVSDPATGSGTAYDSDGTPYAYQEDQRSRWVRFRDDGGLLAVGLPILASVAAPYLLGSGSAAASEAAALAAAENGILGSTVGMAPGTAAAYGTTGAGISALDAAALAAAENGIIGSTVGMAPGTAAAYGAGPAGIAGLEAAGSGAFLGEGVTSGVPEWDRAATRAGVPLAAPPGSDIPLDYSNEGRNYPTPESTQGPGGSPTNTGPSASTLDFSRLLTNPNLMRLLGLGAGALLGATSDDSSGSKGSGAPQGFQGQLPQFSLSRQYTPRTDPNRRPGSGGAHSYFTDTYTPLAKGGIAALQPRMINGPGDGMSDSVAAHIDGKQKAALADGEFVVPADVVSHLGNGSTGAGAKRLYAMMDRIRQARTGSDKQAPAVNTRKYLPV